MIYCMQHVPLKAPDTVHLFPLVSLIILRGQVKIWKNISVLYESDSNKEV